MLRCICLRAKENVVECMREGGATQCRVKSIYISHVASLQILGDTMCWFMKLNRFVKINPNIIYIYIYIYIP